MKPRRNNNRTNEHGAIEDNRSTLLRHPSLSGERRSCGALWGRDWTFTSTGSQFRCRKKARQEPRPPDLRGVVQLSHWTLQRLGDSPLRGKSPSAVALFQHEPID